MGWWKKMFKESIGNSEVRKPEDEPDYSDLEVRDYADSIYDEPNIGCPDPTFDNPIVVGSREKNSVSFKKIDPLDLAKVLYEASPNKSARKGEVKYIVLHHTGSAGSFNGIVNWLCNKIINKETGKPYKAKAGVHYVLGTNGQLKQLISTTREAWHVGVARWEGVQINNHHSIGIEICNIGRMEQGEDGGFYHEEGRSLKKYTGKATPQGGTIVYPSGQAVSGFYVPYPEKQLDKLVALCKALVEKYPAITRDNILTHYDVASPEGRKNDPFGLDVSSIKNRIFG